MNIRRDIALATFSLVMLATITIVKQAFATEVVIEDGLLGPGAVTPGRCQTGKALGEFVGEGFIIKVTGKCRNTDSNASLGFGLKNVTFVNGDARIEGKAVSTLDRVQFGFRFRGNESGGYYIDTRPYSGFARIRKTTDGQVTSLAERNDLSTSMRATDWNTVAVRANGTRIQMLLNDEVVLEAEDSTYVSGDLSLGLLRVGEIDDDQEAAVVYRNLRVVMSPSVEAE